MTPNELETSGDVRPFRVLCSVHVVAQTDKPIVDIAVRIIEQLHGPFDAHEFTDRYEETIRSLIDEK
jgi:non-homologous end joining protein Ku